MRYVSIHYHSLVRAAIWGSYTHAKVVLQIEIAFIVGLCTNLYILKLYIVSWLQFGKTKCWTGKSILLFFFAKNSYQGSVFFFFFYFTLNWKKVVFFTWFSLAWWVTFGWIRYFNLAYKFRLQWGFRKWFIGKTSDWKTLK